MYKFIETPAFTRYIYDYLNDEEYTDLQWHLMLDPERGDVIRGSSGMRKLRWAAKGKGKRGGIRVIYYWQKSEYEIWLLTLYAKNEEENIPVHILREIMKEFE